MHPLLTSEYLDAQHGQGHGWKQNVTQLCLLCHVFGKIGVTLFITRNLLAFLLRQPLTMKVPRYPISYILQWRHIHLV